MQLHPVIITLQEAHPTFDMHYYGANLLKELAARQLSGSIVLWVGLFGVARSGFCNNTDYCDVQAHSNM